MHSASDSISALNRNARVAGWKGTWLGIVGLSLLLAFTWLPNSYVLMVSWPYSLLWQGAFCLLIGWSIWISRQFSQPLSGLGYGLDWIVLFSLVSIALSTLTAQFRLVAGWNLCLFTSYIIVLYLVVSWVRSDSTLQIRLWFSLACSGTVTSIISLSLWRPTVDMWTGKDFYSAIRNPFPLGHHNFVGGYCLLILPLVVGLTLTQTGKRRWIGYGAIAINVIALYVSGSRGALLSALALCIVALPLYVIYYRAKTYKHWILISLLCVFLAGAVVSNPRVRSLITLQPSASTSAITIDQIQDGPTKDRLFMLQAGQSIFKTHPLLGVGPGNLSRVYNLYRPLEVGTGLELVQQLHNTPAQILAELGILGFSGYLLWFGCLLKTGFTLHRQIHDRTDRFLLYSIAASWFAYSISSLTDYQLENFGIASTLLITTALLITLFDSQPSAALSSFSQRNRRLLSLFLLLYLSSTLQLWARADAGFYLASAAARDANNHNLADADAKWTKASALMPWDPTYAALSSEQLIVIREETSLEKNKAILTDAAIASLKSAIKAAPNDPWFNQNLAVLLSDTNPSQAEDSIRRTALLFPRSQHDTYYTLGHIYLNQQKTTQAATAFTLESLVNPSFLTDPIWNSPPFPNLLPDVVTQALSATQQVLSKTAPSSSQYAWLDQQLALLKWWHHQPLAASTIERQSPIVQAVLKIEEAPSLSQNLLARIIQQDSSLAAQKAALIQAWLAPDQYLPKFLDRFEGTSAEKASIVENIRTHRDFRQWLTSIHQPKTKPSRYGLAFAYRNRSANDIRQILSAAGLSTSPLLDELSLFSSPPREFAQLDQKIAEISLESLSLIPPSQNHFQIPLAQ